MFGFGEEKVVKKYNNNIKDFKITKSVAISEYLKIKYGIKVGDVITIDTPKGKQDFRVREIFTSYSTTNGFIIFDNVFQKKYWNDNKFNQINLYVKKGVNVDNVINRLNKLINKNGTLNISNNKTLKRKILNIFDKSFAITYAIQGIALVVSLLGVGNMLYAVALERRKEISILKYLGSSNKLLSNIYTLSSGIVGFFGTIYGVLLGIILSVIILKVVNTKSFGWTIDFYIQYGKLGIFLFILMFFVVLSGFLPIKTIKGIDPKKFASYE
jgi:putative ABC transport system permease protein